MSGKMRFESRCPKCGRPLSVLTRRQRASNERPGQSADVPIVKPICPVGHIYRMGPDEPYNEITLATQ